MPKEDRKKELDAQLNTPPEDEEEETDDEETDDDEEETDEEEDDAGEEEETGDDDEDSEDDEETDDDEEETEEDAGGEASKKDRWHGKSREEVIKAYEELEKQKAPKSKKIEEKPAPQKSEGEEEGEGEIKVPTDEELAKMTPKDFANWMIKSVRDMVSKTYESRSKVRDAVTNEIRDAQKEHPLLKTNAEYRELVLSLIDTAAQKGVVMPLKEACEKVDAFSGKVKGDTKVSEEEKVRLKKAKAQVENGSGKAPASGDEPDKEKAKIEKVFGQGPNKTPLGGLGI